VLILLLPSWQKHGAKREKKISKCDDFEANMFAEKDWDGSYSWTQLEL